MKQWKKDDDSIKEKLEEMEGEKNFILILLDNYYEFYSTVMLGRIKSE